MSASRVNAAQAHERGFSTAAELQAAINARAHDRQQLTLLLNRPDVSGADKHAARCAYLAKHGRVTAQCRVCWLLPAFCVCRALRVGQPQTRVIIHLHHNEWGTGECVFGAAGST
jgi:hypothetical protein